MLTLTQDQQKALISMYYELNTFHFEMQKDFESTYKMVSECTNGMEVPTQILAFNENYGYDFTPSYNVGNLPLVLEKVIVLKEFAENYYEWLMQDRVKLKTIWDLAHNKLIVPELILDEDKA